MFSVSATFCDAVRFGSSSISFFARANFLTAMSDRARTGSTDLTAPRDGLTAVNSSPTRKKMALKLTSMIRESIMERATNLPSIL